jgi:hypothetical protein
MNHREPPHLSAGTRRALRCLALLLVPALAPGGALAVSRVRPASSGISLHGVDPAPYLPVRGALSLRFQEEPPPPDLTTRPAAAAPPTPALTPTETSVAQANAAAARSASVVAQEPVATTPVAPVVAEPVAPPPKAAPAILPDDVRPAARPEDFLPYFQLPGSNPKSPDVTLLVPAPKTPPAPAPLPASSATYTQSPR